MSGKKNEEAVVSAFKSLTKDWEDRPLNSNSDTLIDDLNDTVPELCSAADQAITFDPYEYLRAFYSKPTDDEAMHTILLFLPGILYWIPEKIRTLLDLGAGPTVYVPIIFRKHAEEIYSADYAEMNCDMLKIWAEDKSPFEWNEVCKWIASIEDSSELPTFMEHCARRKFKAVLRVDLHAQPIIRSVYYKCEGSNHIPRQFHVVVSIFCFEYSSENLDDYRRAVRSAVTLIEPNGFLIQGGVLEADDYYFGQRRYKCHHLIKEHVIESLRENNMVTEKGLNFKWFELDQVFLLIAKKKA